MDHIRDFQNYFERRQANVVELTRRLVETESPSGDEAGSKAVVSLLVEASQSIEGVTVERLPSLNYGEHVRIASANPQSKPVAIVGHTDTVHPRGSINERPWRIADGRAYGPGVFDMKANCALGIEVMRAFAEMNLLAKHPLVLLLMCDEEAGSMTGRPIVEAEARNAKAVLVVEPPAPGGKIKTGRKGTGIFSMHLRGRAAHAGLEPEKGASAILEACRQTVRLHEFNNLGGGIRVNVGVIHGGTVSNVVPAEAHAEIDTRFSTTEEAVTLEAAIRSLAPFDDRVQLTITGGINRPPLERTAQVVKLFERAKAIAASLGFELDETQVGGASDGNFAAAVGAPVLDGLGIDGDGAHAAHEHIILEDIPRRGALLAQLIASI